LPRQEKEASDKQGQVKPIEGEREMSDSKLNATESPKLFAPGNKSRDIIVLLLE
jgi:hypothetical protein